eukprot:CAMPEP_0197064240 /NCGR_PEP_ID=MMETSP1384-20130603/157885_1 /TAXON_ID=29189 /ORGANISM="Ammonia sp." /LENGTH=38 /DNA_ID= /DNA_START= /DNA_END= /DNA_ORIENTATION=
MISLDDFKTNTVQSKGLYFDDALKAVFDISIKVDYVRN